MNTRDFMCWADEFESICTLNFLRARFSFQRSGDEKRGSIVFCVKSDIEFDLLSEWLNENPDEESWGMFTIEGAQAVTRAFEFEVNVIRSGNLDTSVKNIQNRVIAQGHSEVEDSAVREHLYWALEPILDSWN